jgi:hypothetical protein
MGARGSFPGGKRPGRVADHSLPSSAEVKGCMELYLHSPVRLHSMVLSLKKHRNNFTFYLYSICCCFVWVCSFVSYNKGRTQIECVLRTWC